MYDLDIIRDRTDSRHAYFIKWGMPDHRFISILLRGQRKQKKNFYKCIKTGSKYIDWPQDGN